MTPRPASRSDARVAWIPLAIVAAAVVAAVTVAVGLTLRLGYGRLGTATPPFVSGWLPAIDPVGALAAVAAAAVVVVVGPRLVAAEWSPAGVAAGLFALTLGAGLAVGLLRHGPHGWIEIFDLDGGVGQGHAINEYLPGLPSLRYGAANYLDRFAEVVPSQSVNVAGHPPGPLLLAYLLGATTAAKLAALVIVIGSLCAPLAYRLAWTLSGEERASRVAGLLVVASPLTLLFGVTSFDYAFAGFGALAACGLVARSARWQAFGLAAFAVSSLMSWALLGVGAWAALVVWRRDGLRAAVRLGLLCGVAVAVVQGCLAAAYGYDPDRDSLARVRPYWFWLFGSPVAWGLMLGPVIVGAVIRAAGGRSPAGLAIVAVVLLASIGGFTKAETERIWLFMVPLACVAAAPYVARARRTRPAEDEATGPGSSGEPTPEPATVDGQRLRVVLAALMLQALVFQLLMNTVW